MNCRAFIQWGFAAATLLLIPSASRGAAVYLSEFMASNSSTLSNSFGEAEDWIELYNASSGAIDLAGWHLTDNPAELSKWTFPSGTIPAKGYLVVWASGRNTVSGGEIHTNFKLDGDGEYLALVRPDGTTVEHAYAPVYPDQKSNVSYGLVFADNGSEITLSDSQTACRYLVPTADIGSAWRQRVFDDGAWLEGLTPIGYDRGGDVIYQAEAYSAISSCSVQSSWSNYTGTGYVDMGGNGSYFEWNAIDGGSGGTATLTFYYASSTDRPCSISVNGTVVGSISFSSTGGFNTWKTKALSVSLSSGNNTVRVTASTSAGGPNVDKVEMEAASTGSGPYDESVNTDVEELMYTNMPSIYLRIPFVVDDPAALDNFYISMAYEDGFAAYLNGVAVASDNLPAGQTAATLAWNASAPASRNEALAVTMAPVFSSSVPQTDLVAGTNMLAIHGLNDGAGSEDLLLQTMVVGALDAGYQQISEGYFATPTPGAANAGSAVGFVADTTFSVDRGFFTNAFAVAVSSATDGATIRYTLDGSTPSEVQGTVYAGPISISGTTVLRAIAYKTGWEPSDVDTQTYIFPDEVIQQPEQPDGWPTLWTGGYSDYEMDPDIVNSPTYSSEVSVALLRIPTLSIVTDQSNLFGSTGIYDNPTREGVAWERPASAELIYPDGTKGFQINCGIRMQGGASRIPSNSPKHSFRLLFKDIYGPSRLNYPLFENSPVDSFDSVILRAGYNNSWIHKIDGQRTAAQYTRDQFARRAQAAMGQAASHGSFVQLYVNGLYWGLYNPSERPEASFAADHLGGDKDEWDATNSGETPFADGDNAAWNTMVNIATNGLAAPEDYEAFMNYCDVENLADFMIVNHFCANADWDHHNWYAARRRRDGDGFHFFCWDSESTVSSSNANTTGTYNAGKPTDLFHNARTNAEFRLMFADRLHKHLFNDGALTDESVSNLWLRISGVVDGVVVAESARWGDYRSPDLPYAVNDHYLVEQARILNSVLPGRAGVLLGQYRGLGLYPDLDAPEFTVHGGVFSNAASVALSGPSDIYYTLDGSDPREFGTGGIHGTLYSGPIVLEHSACVKARCLDGATWSALTAAEFLDVAPAPLRISEIMYAPRLPAGGESAVSGDASDYQFVELYNAGTKTIGLVGVGFVEGIRFDFSKGKVLSLAPGAFALVVKDRPAFLARYPGLASLVAGEFIGDLSDGGEQVRLESVGAVGISFTYGDGRGWPLAADGAGHSLVPVDLAAGINPNYGGNWRASLEVDGSPGAAESASEAALCLNEITGHTDLSDPAYPEYDSNDWIELYNPGTSTVALAGYYLSDDPAELLKWPVPAGLELAPGAFMVFDEITGFHSPITAGFGIDKAGEQVLLSYAPGGTLLRVVDAFSFKGQENGAAIGRYPDGAAYWVETLPTAGTENRKAAPEVVVSEVMYHPVDAGSAYEITDLEYIELYNASGGDVALWTEDGGVQVGSWRINGDVEFSFPADTLLAAEARILLLPFDPSDAVLRSAFASHYGLSDAVPLFGPYAGKLSNRGGRITLEKPQAPDVSDENISWVVVDELFFSDGSPWMPSADGGGYALHRTSPGSSAADPASWCDATPSPGTALVVQPDLRILACELQPGGFRIGFDPLPGTSYVLESSTNLLGVWEPRAVLQNQAEALDSVSPSNSAAFYRLRRE